jgi:hypothetical protein
MYFPKSAESCTLVNKSVEFDMDYTPSVLAKDIVRKANQKHQCDERWMGTLESAKHTYPYYKTLYHKYNEIAIPIRIFLPFSGILPWRWIVCNSQRSDPIPCIPVM